MRLCSASTYGVGVRGGGGVHWQQIFETQLLLSDHARVAMVYGGNTEGVKGENWG